MIDKRPIWTIIPTSKNPRKITKAKLEALKKRMEKYPKFIEAREVVIDENMRILGGHQRVKAAQARGEKTIRVKQVFGWTDEEKDNFTISDNVSDGEWDMDILTQEWDAGQLSEWGVDVPLYKEIVEDKPAPVDQGHTYSAVGDIYELGNHRVLCGSFENAKMLDKLFDDEVATCTFTDPPYNVAVRNCSTGKTIQNDNMAHDDFQEFLDKACRCIADRMKSQGGVISWMSDTELLTLKQAFDDAGLRFRTVICWVKSQFTLGGNDFQSAKELAIYGLGEGKYDGAINETDEFQFALYARDGGKFTDSRKLSNVWFFDKPKANKDHPTMKPIGLCAKGILALSEPEDVVFDPFLGSGSTLIAAEQVGRRCYGCEIDPKYCDVIRKRWWKFTTGNEDGWQKGTNPLD